MTSFQDGAQIIRLVLVAHRVGDTLLQRLFVVMLDFRAIKRCTDCGSTTQELEFFRLVTLYFLYWCCKPQSPRAASCILSFAPVHNCEARNTRDRLLAHVRYFPQVQSPTELWVISALRPPPRSPALADSRFGKDVASALNRAGQQEGAAGKEAEGVEGDEDEEEEGSAEGGDASFVLSDLEDAIEERNRASWRKLGLKRRYTISPAAHRRWATLSHSTPRIFFTRRARHNVDEGFRVRVAPPKD